MKNLTSFFFAFLFVHIIDAQQNTVGLISYDFTQSSVGYNLHYPHNQGNVYLLNACGEIVHRWDDPVYKPGNGIQLKENGLLYVTKGKNALSNSFIHAGGGGEKVEIRNWNNQLLWEKVINDSTQRMHHDIEVLPNGNVLAIVWEYKNDAEAIAAGSGVPPGSGDRCATDTSGQAQPRTTPTAPGVPHVPGSHHPG